MRKRSMYCSAEFCPFALPHRCSKVAWPPNFVLWSFPGQDLTVSRCWLMARSLPSASFSSSPGRQPMSEATGNGQQPDPFLDRWTNNEIPIEMGPECTQPLQPLTGKRLENLRAYRA